MEKKNVRRDHPLGLYLHIPFCKAKCAYCDFYSLARSEEKMDAYTAALQRHLVEVAPQADCHIVDTVYFGGGTPSYLGVKRLTELLKTVKKHYRLAKEPEITVEANPDSACDWKALRALRRAGVPCEMHIFGAGQHGLSLCNDQVYDAEQPNMHAECACWIDMAARWLKGL